MVRVWEVLAPAASLQELLGVREGQRKEPGCLRASAAPPVGHPGA